MDGDGVLSDKLTNQAMDMARPKAASPAKSGEAVRSSVKLGEAVRSCFAPSKSGSALVWKGKETVLARHVWLLVEQKLREWSIRHAQTFADKFK